MSQVQLAKDSLSNPVLKVSNLRVLFSKRYGILNRARVTIRAVDDVSFELGESEILSLVGESGSGKTTIARCIMGLTTPTSGSIRYLDTEVTKLRGSALTSYLRSVQMVFQDPFESLYPRFDVYSTLSVPIRQLTGEKNAEIIRETISKLLLEVGLDPAETMTKLPHQLSGGERQRVSIAKALASNPKVLIADEPITMLDASHRLNILSLLLSLKSKRNLSVLLITHDLASAKFMSDRTAVMYLGRLVEIGPTEALLSKPHHPYSELILRSTPKLMGNKKMVVADPASDESMKIVTTGCAFEPRCKYATSICVESEPKLLEKSNLHYAACHNPLNLEAESP
jgi:peptide/nickel transport system ATP-binding protein